MQFRWDLGVLQGQEHLHAVPAIHRVITGLRQEHGRSRRGHVGDGARCVALPVHASRVNQHREIGTAAQPVRVIDRRIGALVEVGRGPGAQVSARREPEYADPLRVDPPLAGLAPHQAECPLGVQQGLDRWPIARGPFPPRHAVLEHDSRDADRVEPGRNLLALQVEGKDVVTSSRTDHHGHAGVLVTSRPEDRERGVGDVRQQLHRLVTGFLVDDFLGTDGTGLSRCLVGPDIQREGWLSRARRHRGGKPDEHRGEHQVRSHDSGSLRGY